MSVLKSKRGESKLAVITKARELATYTVKICSNEKVFPKRYRWCITSKIVDTVLDIHANAIRANSIYVSVQEDYALRKQFQNKALSQTYSLLSLMDIAYNTFNIEDSKIEYWTGLVLEAQALIRKWRNSDAERYKTQGNS